MNAATYGPNDAEGLHMETSEERVTPEELREMRDAVSTFGVVDSRDDAGPAVLAFDVLARFTRAADTIESLTTELTSGEAAHCYGSCGWLGWTFEKYGRIVHKHACERRGAMYCQTHPDGCDVAPWQALHPQRATDEETE
jgi:hypothetical protein